MKAIKTLLLSILCPLSLLFTLVACNTQEFEGVFDPETGLVTIPYTLKASTLDTKVSFDAGTKHYGVKDGDYLVVTGTDIIGILSYMSGNGFSGTLSYESSTYPSGLQNDTPLHARLVNVDNDTFDGSSYAGAVAASLKDAVEKYSLFTGDFTYGNKESNVSLYQQSAFIEFSITFQGNPGLTVDTPVTISDGGASIATGTATITNGVASFAIAVVGNSTTLSSPKVDICGKEVSFDGANLLKNKYYSVARTIYPAVGDPFYNDGIWGGYGHADGKIPVGVVVYVNKGNSSLHPTSGTTSVDAEVFADGVTEKSGESYGHGLVMALSNCNIDPCKWSNNQNLLLTSGVFTSKWQTWSQVHNFLINDFKGKAKTAYLQQPDVNDYVCYAANAVGDYNNSVPVSGTNHTGWFLPSCAQWIAAFVSQGVTTDYLPADNSWGTYSKSWTVNDSGQNGTYPKLLALLQAIDNNVTLTAGWYWSSSQIDEKRAFSVAFDFDDGLSFSNSNKFADNYLRNVRPFLAF